MEAAEHGNGHRPDTADVSAMSGESGRSAVIEALRSAHAALATAARCAGGGAVGGLAGIGADELLEAGELAGAIARVSDALMVETVGALERQGRQSATGLGEPSLAARHGLRDAAALITVLTGASRRSVRRWRQAGSVTLPREAGSAGLLPPSFPVLAEAFGAGTVSLDQALVIREHLVAAAGRACVEDLDAAERALVASAVGVSQDCAEGECGGSGWDGLPLSPELLGVQARAWRNAIDQDGPEPAFEEQQRRRSFTFGRRSDGMWVGKLVLPAEQGEAIRLALDAHNAPRASARFEGESTSGAAPTGAGEATDGVDAPGTGAGMSRGGRIDARTTAQRQADTMVGLITRAMELADAPRVGGEAATVVVTITEAELREHAATGGGAARLDSSGEVVPAHVAARIICDGNIQACLLDDDGLPLKLGRARRSHTRHQRRAILTAYPGGCQNPGCDAPPGFTEIHHPIWWADGGCTDAHNGIPLCQHCHTEVHIGRLRCVRDPDGRWRVVAALPIGSRIRLAA